MSRINKTGDTFSNKNCMGIAMILYMRQSSLTVSFFFIMGVRENLIASNYHLLSTFCHVAILIVTVSDHIKGNIISFPEKTSKNVINVHQI